MTTEILSLDSVPARTLMSVDSAVKAAIAKGLTFLNQSAFVKIVGAKGAGFIYIAKTKKGVTRVDISGFEASWSHCTSPRAPNGKVTQELRIEDTAEATLLHLEAVLDTLASAPPVEVVKRAPKASSSPASSPVEAPMLSVEEVEAKQRAKAELLAKVAAEHGVAVSSNANLES